MKLLIGGVVALAVLASGGAWYLTHNGNGHSVFRTARVERGDLVTTVSATGTVEPEDLVDVGAQVAGKIVKFGADSHAKKKVIDYGSLVEEGTVLCQLDDSLYLAMMEQAKANKEQAEANVAQAEANVVRTEADILQMEAKLKQAERDWNRVRTLGFSKGATSEQDRDTALANYETAKSVVAVGKASKLFSEKALLQSRKALEQAEAGLRQAEVNLGYTTIKSPVKGIIVDRRVNVGQTVVASLSAPSLFLIAKDLKKVEVWASVNEADITKVKLGQQVTFTTDAYPNQTFKGEVTQIRLNAQMTQNVVTYPVVVSTDNTDGKLRLYLTATLQFQVGRRSNVLKVPNTALRWRPKAEQVVPESRDAYAKYLKRRKQNDPQSSGSEGDDTTKGVVWVPAGEFVRPVQVELGLSDGTMTEISKGDLEEGADLVTGVTLAKDADNTVNPFATPRFDKPAKK